MSGSLGVKCASPSLQAVGFPSVRVKVSTASERCPVVACRMTANSCGYHRFQRQRKKKRPSSIKSTCGNFHFFPTCHGAMCVVCNLVSKDCVVRGSPRQTALSPQFTSFRKQISQSATITGTGTMVRMRNSQARPITKLLRHGYTRNFNGLGILQYWRVNL